MPYRVLSPDTSEQVQRMQFEHLRRIGRKARFESGLAIVDESAAMMERALRRLHPDWTPEQLMVEWIRVQYGEQLARDVARAKSMELPPTLAPRP